MSPGAVQVLEWLLQCREAQLNSKDAESGYSPLHRAAFHGQLRTLVWLLQVAHRKIFGAVKKYLPRTARGQHAAAGPGRADVSGPRGAGPAPARVV